MDNYYGSDQIAHHLRSTRSINIVATLQKKNTCPEIRFGNAKRPKPSRANPKGAYKAAKTADNIYMYSWIYSAAVYFVDSAYGSGSMQPIQRKDQNGQRVNFVVPAAIPEYNNGMHGADVWDQIRKDFGIDLLHPTSKWTLRIFEIFWSLITTQAYNIYRHNNKNNVQRQLNQHQFKLAIILGLLNHPVVVGPPTPPANAQSQHQICQWPVGSRGVDDVRRFHSDCRQCPRILPDGTRNNSRITSFYCSSCMVGLHPECFAKYHEGKPNTFLPKKRLNVNRLI
jgi:hypothetical protein